jgi:hypothetical protein
MAGGSKKSDDASAQASAAAEAAATAAKDSGAGFPVGTTLVARWMGQVERTCVVIDRSEFTTAECKRVYANGRTQVLMIMRSFLCSMRMLIRGDQQGQVQVLRALA